MCFIDDDITWSSRSVPVGTATEEIDVMTIRLRLPIWLTAPAKVRKLKRIEEIVANIGDRVFDPIDGSSTIGNLYGRVIVTPGNYCITVDGNVITLLSDKGDDTLADGSIPSWSDLITLYGLFTPNVSEMNLFLTSDIEGAFVSGTLNYGSEPNQLIWSLNADTLPGNTLLPVSAVIDPQRTYPYLGISPQISNGVLPPAANGTRYLLVNNIGTNTIAWGGLSAQTNDIIQYNGSAWVVVFNSSANVSEQYVQNLHTGRQLRWTGKEWLMSIDTFYGPGLWRLML